MSVHPSEQNLNILENINTESVLARLAAANHFLSTESACGFVVNALKFCFKINMVQESDNVYEVTVSFQCVVHYKLIFLSLRFSF